MPRLKQQLMASIEPHGDFGYPGYTLQPPFRIAPATFSFDSDLALGLVDRDAWPILPRLAAGP